MVFCLFVFTLLRNALLALSLQVVQIFLSWFYVMPLRFFLRDGIMTVLHFEGGVILFLLTCPLFCYNFTLFWIYGFKKQNKINPPSPCDVFCRYWDDASCVSSIFVVKYNLPERVSDTLLQEAPLKYKAICSFWWNAKQLMFVAVESSIML